MSTLEIEDWWPKTIDEFCVNLVARHGEEAVHVVQNFEHSFCGGFVGYSSCVAASTCTKCPASGNQEKLKKEFLLYLFNKES